MLRREKQLTLDKLAMLTGVSRAMLGQICTGRSVPTVDVAGRIAGGLQVDISVLLTASPSKDDSNDHP